MSHTLLLPACRVRVLCPDGPITAQVIVPAGEETLAVLAPRMPSGTALIAIDQTDWNRDFSPWPAPAVFGREDFSGGGPALLRALTDEVLPAVDRLLPAAPRVLAGYSLAGLFAVWAGMCTNAFAAVVSASGSLWYDGFVDFARAHPCHAKAVYLSVGDREKRTRSERMQRVEDAIRETRQLLDAQGIRTCFELNPGNHFQQADERLARGIVWAVTQVAAQAASFTPSAPQRP